MKSLKKNMGLAAVISASFVFAGVASQDAMAHSTGKKHTHSAARKSTSGYSSTVREVHSDTARVSNLEAEVADLRSQLSAQQSAHQQFEAKQQQLETQVAEEAAKENAKNDMVFFRGGYAALEHGRTNELLTGGDAGLNPYGKNYGSNKNGEGWYVGAGFDHRLTDDLWGATDLIALDAELMFEYQNFGKSYNAFVSSVVGTPIRNQVTMFTLSASPKMKFNLLDNNLRPWIIPFGLSMNVVSPPSSGVTVLNPGLMLGTGLEYRIWKDLWLGTDFRYQFTGGDLSYKVNGPNGTLMNHTTTNGLTAGGYIGIGF